MAGIAVFALSGALLAAAKKQTLVTFLFFAVVTGIGGGTVRDLLIGAPVFWVHENWTLLICFAAALAVWLLPARLWRGSALLWFDAAGLAAYATYRRRQGARLRAGADAGGRDGGADRLPRRHHPRRARRRALDPDAARALRHRRRFVGGVAGRPDPGGRAGRRSPASSPPLSGFALRGAAIWRGWSLPAYGR